MEHLRILLNLSFFATTNLVKFIFSIFTILSLILIFLILSHLLVCFICSISSALFEISIDMLDIGQHLDGNMSYNKEKLGIMHISDVSSEGATHVRLIFLTSFIF
jgi:hypothetical protein